MSNLLLFLFLAVFSVSVALLFLHERMVVVKFAMVGLLFCSSTAVLFSLESYKGWASEDSLPDSAKVIYAEVVQPTVNSQGAIYVWVSQVPPAPWYSYSKPGPRAFELPYSQALASQAAQAQASIKNGGSASISRGTPGDGSPSGGIRVRVTGPQDSLAK